VPAPRAGVRERSSPRRGEHGFTLIELLITLAVTLIGISGLLTLYMSVARANAVTGRLLEGSDVAEQVIEDHRGMSSAALVAAYGPLPIAADLAPAAGRNDLEFRRRLLVESVGVAPTAMLRLRAEVRWTDGGAVPGSEGGIHDHRLLLEFLREPDGTL
jgi:prepilin-type N-terminal cleavage/methylation domain-containing protein